MKKNKYEIDMCNGTLMDKLISFAIPLMLSGILQRCVYETDRDVISSLQAAQTRHDIL